uniref:Alpha kinase 1 n=1 Tax=Astyanax mexicanus TaxID=7994 RepID=A0A3B1IE49_ASTMX
MNAPDVSALLEECLRLAETQRTEPDSETHRTNRADLSAELRTLLGEAVEMRWPFVEEKWQYKSSVTPEDKVNTKDLVSHNLPQLMAFLKSSIVGAEPLWAMSVVFLVDRFLYWKDSSHTLLKIAKALHRNYPETPVAPQVIIRQARVYLNTGKLQKAEYILSSLINNNGATGSWRYQRDSDRVLVQAVSLQVRGQVLQKLGLWLEAAELIWASLVGFYILPLPDKKGIGTSLGLLASLLISMTDKDFSTFQKIPHINLGFLGDCRHRLLCAAQAAKSAVIYSQFDPLYVLTHMITQGTCLLSYSFSRSCPAAEKPSYLALAKEAFEIGLLTKVETDTVTSQQELHTLIKAAFCLSITNKWMLGPVEEVSLAVQACQEANALLYSYCFEDDSDKVLVSSEVMAKVQRVKMLLKVKDFSNSDPHSFIPDSYRVSENRPAAFTLEDFTEMVERFQKHHKSVCEAFEGRGLERSAAHDNCLTAFQTTALAEPLTTECSTRDPGIEDDNEGISDSSGSKASLGSSFNEVRLKKMFKLDRRTSEGSSSLASSWPKTSSSGSSFELVDPIHCTEVDEDVNGEKNIHKSQCKNANSTSSSHGIGDNQQSTLPSSHSPGVLNEGVLNTQQTSKQELCTTLGSEDHKNSNQMGPNASGSSSGTRTSSGSLSSSLGSSWQSFSFSTRSPTNEGGGSSKTLKGSYQQSVQSSIETVEDLDVFSVSDGLSGLVLSGNNSPNGLNAQQQAKTELCTTLGSEDHETTKKILDTDATGKSKDSRMSSGSFCSSLNSSWQSVLFSTRSPPVNQNCGTVDKSPDSPFQELQPNSPGTSAEGLMKTQTANHSQTQVQIQSFVETVEDLDGLSLSDGLSGRTVAGNNSPTGLNAQQSSKKQDLCTTLESEDDKTTKKVMTNASGSSSGTRTSSGSLSSSLGSSWQSISFSTRSPTNEGGGSFKTLKGRYQQSVQSSIETVEDLDVFSLSDDLSGHTAAGNGSNGLNAQQQSKPELRTTLESKECNATGKSKGTRMSSGSLSSSLNSSWQKASFSRSPPNEDFGPILKNKPETGNVDGLSGHANVEHPQGSASLPSSELDSFVMVPSDHSSASSNRGKDSSPADSPTIQRPSHSDLQDNPSKNRSRDLFPSYMTCSTCFQGCTMGSVVLTEQDYRSLLSGVCQGCLLRRLPDQTFKLRHYNRAYSGVLLKYSKVTESWTGSETSVFVGGVLQVAVEGRQRQAFRIQYLHQEQLLGSYVGKEYLRERKPHAHLADVERQMTAQFYVMEFNKRLYESNKTTQIFYIPSELLLITEADCMVACVSVEPYMLGDFVKLTNNTTKKNKRLQATDYGIAFGHFTYAFSNQQEVVVDLQGWVTANGKGLAYLTDPQIHSLRKPKSPSNFHQNGILKFLQQQHGERCGPVCCAALQDFPQHLLK